MRKSFSRQEGNERRESPAKISLRIIPLAGSSVRQALLRCEVSTPPMTALGSQADQASLEPSPLYPGGFNWSAQHLLILRDEEVFHGDVTD